MHIVGIINKHFSSLCYIISIHLHRINQSELSYTLKNKIIVESWTLQLNWKIQNHYTLLFFRSSLSWSSCSWQSSCLWLDAPPPNPASTSTWWRRLCSSRSSTTSTRTRSSPPNRRHQSGHLKTARRSKTATAMVTATAITGAAIAMSLAMVNRRSNAISLLQLMQAYALVRMVLWFCTKTFQ